jgi:hypothetical protein
MDAPERFERAYAAGDHRVARAEASAIVRAGQADETRMARARKVLRDTEVDWFLPALGLVGLGVLAWLVYNYWL